MNVRRWFRHSIAGAAAIALAVLVPFSAGFAAAASPSVTRPNIVLILTDDQGFGDLSAHGNPVLRTPNLDRLHDEGVRFTDFHVSPSCAPTRAALMTGRHEFKNGVTHTILERERLALGATTIADVLQAAGYATGIFGKWHLGDEEAYRPERRGFGEVFIHGGGGIGQTYPGSCGDAPGNTYFDPVLWHNGTFVKTKGYCTDLFFERALGWMTAQHEARTPFFAYIPTNTPHSPLVAKPADKARYEGKGLSDIEATFFGMIHAIDENVGRLLDRLDDLGIADNTLVIFMNDNGGTGGIRIFNAGMKGGKLTPWLGGTRSSSLWRWPGRFTPADCPALTAHIDFFPTIAELAGATVTEATRQQVEGRTLVPLLRNPAAAWPERMVFTHAGRWGKGQDPAEKKYRMCAVRTPRWTLVSDTGAETPRWQLFDVRADPSQNVDVIDAHPEVVRDLSAAFDRWWDECVPLMVNEQAVAPQINPFQELYYRQFGGSPTPEALEKMNPDTTARPRASPSSGSRPAWHPRFSWDTVPVYQMFGSHRLHNDAQVRTIAATSDFICIEKAHGVGDLGAAERGAKHEIARFKQANPRTRALFYFNPARAWPFTSYSQGLRFGVLQDDMQPLIARDPTTGELAHDDRIYAFDVLNPAFRTWRTETAAKGVSETGADGLFVDQMHGNVRFHPGKHAEVAAAQAEMMRMVKAAIGDEKILLLNNGAHVPALFEVGDAFMFEHYRPELVSKQSIVDEWALIKKIARAGKIAVWRIGVEVQPTGSPRPFDDRDSREQRDEKLEALSQEQVDFHLATFLIGAQDCCYFQYGWGFRLETGPLVVYPALKNPLGKPLGDFTRLEPAGWRFTRDFEHVNVAVDLERRTGHLQWKAASARP